LRFNPVILLVSERDGLADSCHSRSPNSKAPIV
jgi:hypothetical protein